MGEREGVCSRTLKQRFAPAAGFVAAANAVLRGAAEAPAEPESFVSFVHSYSPSSGLSAESFSAPSAEMLARLARDGCVSRILDFALRAHELFDAEGRMLPTLPVPGPCHPPEQHVVGLSAELVDAALAFILFCAKSEEDQYDEPFFPTLQDLQYPDTVQALLGHFLLPPHQRVTSLAHAWAMAILLPCSPLLALYHACSSLSLARHNLFECCLQTPASAAECSSKKAHRRRRSYARRPLSSQRCPSPRIWNAGTVSASVKRRWY